MRALRDDEDAITFIGTIILVHDTRYKTILPAVHDDLPTTVWLVIDGQQRLTTLSLVLLHTHNAIREFVRSVRKTHPNQTWLIRRAVDLMESLKLVLSIQKPTGDDVYRNYPRLVRAFDDQWATKAGTDSSSAHYRSPIAQYVFEYIKTVLATNPIAAPRFKWKPNPINPDRAREYDLFEDRARQIERQIKRLHQGNAIDDDDEGASSIPDMRSFDQYEELQERFLGSVAPEEARSCWRESNDDAVAELTRLISFGRYVLNRVAVTEVQVRKEEYAFDLFEALNTTGEPLTAFETFKPVVIRFEGLAKFQTSESARLLSYVEAFLATDDDPRKPSDRLLIPFALLEHGRKLGKPLREQRNWLRLKYDESGLDAEGKRDFVRGMSVLARFLRSVWDCESGTTLSAHLTELGLGKAEASQAALCLRVLANADHDITVAILARAYEALLNAELPHEKSDAAREFAGIVAAVTAFFVFWRSSRSGTKGLDKVHRDMLDRDIGGIGPFRRVNGEIPTAARVAERLRLALVGQEGGIVNRATFVKRASNVGTYGESIPMTRFMLMAATHDEIVDPKTPGLTMPGKPGACPMLSVDQWEADFQVEHIAPRNARGDQWPLDIYSEQLIDTLGNLHLLPKTANAVASNRDWRTKHAYYQVLISIDPVESARLVENIKTAGVDLTQPGADVLSRTRVMPHLTAIVGRGELGWTAEWIKTRTDAMLGQVWDRLAPWLMIGPEEASTVESAA